MLYLLKSSGATPARPGIRPGCRRQCAANFCSLGFGEVLVLRIARAWPFKHGKLISGKFGHKQSGRYLHTDVLKLPFREKQKMMWWA